MTPYTTLAPLLLQESMRWYGPNDPVPLSYIRQAGASAVFTSLHQIPYGDAWPVEAIRERKAQLAPYGLDWAAVESVPVHENIKTGTGDLETLFENYRISLRNLASEGIKVVVYNFMPVLDWVRTDMSYVLPDGSECLRFDPVKFAAFETLALKRPGAEQDYSEEQLEKARAWWSTMDEAQREEFIQSVIDVFPGVKWGLKLDDIRAMLAKYDQIDAVKLAENLQRFHEAVIPTAEEVGVRLAIHPDDPPFPILGLPRIVSTASDVRRMLAAVDSPANGLCFCTGSFSVREDNDLPGMVREFGPRIHAVHLRSTQRLPDGSFFEADHLAGSVNMPAVLRELLAEQTRRREQGWEDWRLAFRPDHGHVMMDDLGKPDLNVNPGYSCIGRMRGLAELRGLMLGLIS
jgi:mannonate dehydratase